MHYPKKLREPTEALVECCQLIGGYVGHYGRIERSHPLFQRMRDLTMEVAVQQTLLFEKHRIKKSQRDLPTLEKVKKAEPALQAFFKRVKKRKPGEKTT